jgi:threonine dehydratase
MVQISDVLSAEQRIQQFVHRTPVLTSNSLDRLIGAQLFFKPENLQKIGAFKARGAFNFALQLNEDERANGLCTHSSGNHAQAVALVALELGIPAYIVMPSTSPNVKVAAVKGYGAEVLFCEPTLAARESNLARVQEKTGAYFIPPYDHEWIITGQATAAKELFEDCKAQLDVVVCPVGGGGLLAGTALSTTFFSPATAVIGAEPEGAADAFRSFKNRTWEPSVEPKTIADGLLTSLGQINFPIIRDHVSDIYVVSDDEIVAAMKLVFQRMKLVVEPSAAVSLAAIIKNKKQFQGKKVGVMLSGGNVDLERLPF